MTATRSLSKSGWKLMPTNVDRPGLTAAEGGGADAGGCPFRVGHVIPARRAPAAGPRPKMGMEYRRLGTTGLRVSRLGLGCGNFGGIGSAPAFYGMGENEEEAFALMDRAYEAGINF